MWHRAMMADYKIRDWEEPLSEGNLKRLEPFTLEGVNQKEHSEGIAERIA